MMMLLTTTITITHSGRIRVNQIVEKRVTYIIMIINCNRGDEGMKALLDFIHRVRADELVGNERKGQKSNGR